MTVARPSMQTVGVISDLGYSLFCKLLKSTTLHGEKNFTYACVPSRTANNCREFSSMQKLMAISIMEFESSLHGSHGYAGTKESDAHVKLVGSKACTGNFDIISGFWRSPIAPRCYVDLLIQCKSDVSSLIGVWGRAPEANGFYVLKPSKTTYDNLKPMQSLISITPLHTLYNNFIIHQ